MADFVLKNSISKISSQSILVVTAKAGNEVWFAEDIDIVISGPTIPDRTAPIIIDFSYSVPTIVEYTLDGGITFVALNDGVALTGGQSRFIRVTDGNQLNFRATQAGNLNRAIIGEP